MIFLAQEVVQETAGGRGWIVITIVMALQDEGLDVGAAREEVMEAMTPAGANPPGWWREERDF